MNVRQAEDLVVPVLAEAITLAIRLLGENEARKLTWAQLEIVASRVAADTEAAAKFGKPTPPDGLT
jgi:hypothetical protein